MKGMGIKDTLQGSYSMSKQKFHDFPSFLTHF